MKAMLIGEVVGAKLNPSFAELLGFASRLGAEVVGLVMGDTSDRPSFAGKLVLAAGPEYAPQAHKAMVQELVAAEKPDLVVLVHSAYGWDLAPRLAVALSAPQISEVKEVTDGVYQVGVCNGKLVRQLAPNPGLTILTLQAGAFAPAQESGSPTVENKTLPSLPGPGLVGYKSKPKTGVDLSKAERIVSVGRGIGKKENIELARKLAAVLKAELGSSRPVVDAGWIDPSHQVGSTGTTVAPKLYLACGISGAVQHLAGMKKSELIIAVNKDKEAPIGEVARYFVVADLMEFLPALTEALQ